MFTCDPEKHSISNPNHPQHQHTQPRRHRLIHIYKYNQLRIVWTLNTIFMDNFLTHQIITTHSLINVINIPIYAVFVMPWRMGNLNFECHEDAAV